MTIDPTPPTPSSPPALVAAASSHPGHERTENEDAFGIYPRSRLYIVADGMGGRAAGVVASRIAVDELERFFREQHAQPRAPWPFPVDQAASLGANLLRVGIKVANQKIREAAAANAEYHRMGATLAALAIGETQIVVAHVGDVRVYRLRDGTLKSLTRDHSVVAEMRAARPDLSEQDLQRIANRNVVTRALGTREEVEPTLVAHRLAQGDVYLLCCDGLWDTIPEEAIATILGCTSDVEAAAQLLVDAANTAGGPDNITALVVRVG